MDILYESIREGAAPLGFQSPCTASGEEDRPQGDRGRPTASPSEKEIVMRANFRFLPVTAGILLGLTSCVLPFEQRAQDADREARRKLVNTPQPRCTLPRQCEAMWAAARDWITQECGYKIQTATDSLIETFNSSSMELQCRATKTPAPEGGYSFNAAAGCDNMFGCHPSVASALQEFADRLNQVGAAFKD
jgi:hypothetical protein